MITQPNALVMIPGLGTNLVPENMWKFFSQMGDATFLTAKVKALAPDATYYDGLREFGIGVVYLDANTKLWTIKGTIRVNEEKTLNVWENVGWLFDRILNPNPFVDRNPDSSLGGQNLKYLDVDGATAQLYWGK